MTVSIVYHTRFGNNAKIAEFVADCLESKGFGVSVHPINEARTSEIPASDIYVIGSPTQIGSLPARMTRFLKKMSLKRKSRFAVFATFAQAGSRVPAKIIELMTELGATQVGDPLLIGVKDLKGPLEDGWEDKAKAWVDQLS